MTFQAWIPPAGEVVDPPVHVRTKVDVLFSDRDEASGEAGDFNWSGQGDGPKIIAYAVVEEYVEKREPREWWMVRDERQYDYIVSEKKPSLRWAECIHVREVLPEAPLDLTKITTPFGLLDEATQAALRAHGGPYHLLCATGDWVPVSEPDWLNGLSYRVAPSAAPAKPAPREVVDKRPANCRFRLQDEGKAYPRSSCGHCHRKIATGLGNKCSFVPEVSP